MKRLEDCGASAASDLLSRWTECNHTVTELFMVLYRLHQYNSMEILKPLVDQKFHRLIPNSELKPAFSKLLNNASRDTTQQKILNGPTNSNSSNYTTSGNESDSMTEIGRAHV